MRALVHSALDPIRYAAILLSEPVRVALCAAIAFKSCQPCTFASFPSCHSRCDGFECLLGTQTRHLYILSCSRRGFTRCTSHRDCCISFARAAVDAQHASAPVGWASTHSAHFSGKPYPYSPLPPETVVLSATACLMASLLCSLR